jgi:mannosyltransferase
VPAPLGSRATGTDRNAAMNRVLKTTKPGASFVPVVLPTVSSSPKIDASNWTSAEKILFAALFLFAAAVGVIGIERPIFIDEAYSIFTAGLNLHGIIGQLRTDPNLPLYFVFLHGWIGIFGTSEIAARAPSVLFYFLGILTAGKLGKEVSQDARVGLYSAFFYAASLQAIHIAQKVRVYTLLGLLAGLSTLFFFRCFWKASSGWRDWILYILINVAGSFAHLWFAFVIAAQFICYFVFFPRATSRRFLGSIVLSGIPFLLIWGRFLLQQVANVPDWMPRTDLWSAPGAILEFYGGKIAGTIILTCCILLFFLAKNRQPAQTDANGTRAQWALLLIFSLSIAVPLLVSLIKPIYWPGRYTIIALPSLAVLLGWLLAARVRPPLLAGFACVVLVSVLILQIVSRRDLIENSDATLAYADSDQRAAELLALRIRPGDSLVFTGLSRASVQYYLQQFHRDQGITMISFPAVNAEHLGWSDDRPGEDALAAEASQLTTRLAQSNVNGTAHFWILLGANPLADHVLLENMDQHFTALGILRCRGAFFSGVVIYPNTPLMPPS